MTAGTEKNTNDPIDIPNDVDYVIIELARKQDIKVDDINFDEKDIVMTKGLFMGLTIQNGDIFIVMTADGKDVRLYNSEKYNISFIEFGHKEEKTISVFFSTEVEQEIAMDEISRLLVTFQNNDKVSDDEDYILVDLLKGYELDSVLFALDGKPVPTGFKSQEQYDDWELAGGYGYNGNGIYAPNNYTPHTPHTPITYTTKIARIKRSSKTPTKAKLFAMREKVIAVTLNGGKKLKKPKTTQIEKVDVEEALDNLLATTTTTTKEINHVKIKPEDTAGTTECYLCNGNKFLPTGRRCHICNGSGRQKLADNKKIKEKVHFDPDEDGELTMRKIINTSNMGVGGV